MIILDVSNEVIRGESEDDEEEHLDLGSGMYEENEEVEEVDLGLNDVVLDDEDEELVTDILTRNTSSAILQSTLNSFMENSHSDVSAFSDLSSTEVKEAGKFLI